MPDPVDRLPGILYAINYALSTGEFADYLGVSRQRASQILKKNDELYERWKAAREAKAAERKAKQQEVDAVKRSRTCNRCGNPFLSRRNGATNNYCSIVCLNLQRAQWNREGTKKYYREHPEYRQALAERSKTPEAKAYFKAYNKRRWATDPAYREKVRARYLKLKNDPAYRERQLAYSRARYLKRKAEKEQNKEG